MTKKLNLHIFRLPILAASALSFSHDARIISSLRSQIGSKLPKRIICI